MGVEESAEPPHNGRKPRRWMAATAVTLSVILLAGALATLLWLHPFGSSVPLVSTTGWQTYSDPQHLFSLKVPADWSIEQSQGTGSFGDSTGSYTYTGEEIWLGVPPATIDGMGVAFDVEPLTTDFARHWACADSGRFTPNTTLAQVPAYFDGRTMWTVDTHDAHFQVNAHYPGGPGSTGTQSFTQTPPPTATPVPASQATAGKEIIATVLASLTLMNPTSLNC